MYGCGARAGAGLRGAGGEHRTGARCQTEGLPAPRAPGDGAADPCPTTAPHRNASGGQGTGPGVLVRTRRLTGNPGSTSTRDRGRSARKATGERNILQSNGAGVGESFPVAGVPPLSLRPPPPGWEGKAL